MQLEAIVKFTKEGWHYWPKAKGLRAYLSHSHRHLFHIEVHVEVFHQEREIEYHDLQGFCTHFFPGGNMGSDSCETMATNLLSRITSEYPNRVVSVQCMEDGEVGAYVHS